MKITYTRQFKKDFKKAEKQQRNLEELKTVINDLLAKGVLDPSFRDHPLVSNWKGYRECHLSSDWLLIYKRTPEELILVRMGTHSELFK